MNLRNDPWHVRVFIIGHEFAERYDNESVFACEYYCSTADNDVLELNDYLTTELDDGYVLADDFVFPSEAPEELIIITECNLDVANSCRRQLGLVALPDHSVNSQNDFAGRGAVW